MKLTDEQIDSLTEVVNIGVGRAAAALSDLVDKHIELTVPSITISSLAELQKQLEAREDLLDTSIIQDFRGSVTGRSVLAFPRTSGLKLGQILSDLEAPPDELDLDLSGILVEVGNIVLNGVLGSISNMLQIQFDYSVPEMSLSGAANDLGVEQESTTQAENRAVILTDAHFRVAESQIDGSLILMFQVSEIESALRNMMSAV
jgi:chemotaxis protein CheC